jgi:NDP-sugar pyrophosphorylase family protein
MDVRAIILVGGRGGDNTSPERVCGIPIGMLDVLGEPVVQRVLARLEHVGVTDACIVTEIPPESVPMGYGSMRPNLKWLSGTGEKFWRCAEAAFSDFAQAGAELLLLVRVGAYAEIDYEEFIQQHLDRGARVSCAVDSKGVSLDTLVVSASRRNDAAFLLRHELKNFRSQCEEFKVTSYINRLETAADLRRLTLDCFAQEVSFTPAGTEVKPGVWVGEGARIHRSARVLAPAFIGAQSRVRALAVVTRASVIEHHAELDCGSVIDGSSMLPFCYVGPGLDLSQSVAGFRRIANLRRNVEVTISEAKFVGNTKRNPAVRAVSSAWSLAAFLPWQFARGLFKKARRPGPATLPEAINTPSAALNTLKDLPASENERDFSADLAVARRYGNE